MNTLLLGLYRYLLVPLALCLLPLAVVFHRKVRRGFNLRRLNSTLPHFSVRPIWIHAASGEFEYAKALIRELKDRVPHIPIVVTYFSPSYASTVHRFAGVDFALPLPLDLPGPCRSFLKKVQPRVLLLARTDFWPEMLTQCKQFGVPRVVFSYTQKEVHGKLRRRLKRWLLSLVDEIECVSETDRAALLQLDAALSVHVGGDTRYDQVAHRLFNSSLSLSNGERFSKTRENGGPPCLIAGSTWPEDEQVLLTALTPLLQRGELRLFIVPHEPTSAHLNALEIQLKAQNLRWQRWSQLTDWGTSAVVLVDQTGVLAELYTYGELAFVGGSFKGSVHSVMEALGSGAKTFVGPDHHNNRETMEYKRLTIAGEPGVHVVYSAEELRLAIESVLENQSKLESFKLALLQEFNRRTGASRRLTDRLMRILNDEPAGGA